MILALALALTPVRAGDEALAEKVEAFVAPLLADAHLSGSLLVAHGDQVLLERSFGFANRELGVPNGPGTRYLIASISKPMTQAICLRLFEREVLSPSDRLAKWIPDFPDAESITVEHLLTHRSGIPHRVTTREQETQPSTAAEMVACAAEKDLLFEPGTESAYSSAGYSVLARVIELATGKPFEEVLREEIFEPAGMTSSSHADHTAILPGRAASYLPELRGVRNAPLQDYSHLVGAGSVYSTPRDLLAFLVSVRDGRLGDAVQRDLGARPRVDWDGIANGFRAFLDYDAESDVAVVFTGNVHAGAVDLLRAALPRLVAGEDVEVPERLAIVPAEVPPEAFDVYEGVYEVRPGSRVRVRRDEGRLMAEDWLLVPLGNHRFFSPQDYARVTAILVGGRVVRLDWSVGERTFACPRVMD